MKKCVCIYPGGSGLPWRSGWDWGWGGSLRRGRRWRRESGMGQRCCWEYSEDYWRWSSHELDPVQQYDVKFLPLPVVPWWWMPLGKLAPDWCKVKTISCKNISYRCLSPLCSPHWPPPSLQASVLLVEPLAWAFCLGGGWLSPPEDKQSNHLRCLHSTKAE